MEIKATPEEITALVAALQGRQEDAQLLFDGKEIAKSVTAAIGNSTKQDRDNV